MDRINIQASSDYDVLIGTGLIDTCGTHIRECLIRAQKALIVTDSNVAPLYLGRVRSSLEREGFSVSEYVFEAGEEKKNIDSIAGMWAVMAEEEFTRTDIVVSLGGGVATDMGGFAAATFLRGIKVVQIPTSLLAMADAALGGKTGIDLPQGKNLAGAFHQPSMVIEDTDCLSTLPSEVFTEGMAEVIKYAFIMDKDLYEVLSKISSEGRAMSLQEDIDTLTKILISCVKDKAEVITEDEKDNGRRQTLNFGHTVGHVIERDSGFAKPHGICVAKGMGIVIDSCVRAGTLSEEDAKRMKDLLTLYKLPVTDDITPEAIVEGAMNDKKKRGDTLSVILVNKIGKAEIKKMNKEEFLKFLSV